MRFGLGKTVGDKTENYFSTIDKVLLVLAQFIYNCLLATNTLGDL